MKTLNPCSGTELGTKAEIIWCNPFSDERRFLREEEKFSREPKTKNRKRKIFKNEIFAETIWCFRIKFISLRRVIIEFLFPSRCRREMLAVFLYVCVCACVKDEKLGIFPDVDAVKHQEMPNLPLFGVSERVLCEKWTIYPPMSRSVFYGLKNGFCDFLT